MTCWIYDSTQIDVFNIDINLLIFQKVFILNFSDCSLKKELLH